MARTMFVNLPVSDLRRSVSFFSALGFTFNGAFTDDRAAAMVVGDEVFVMLLVEDFFTTFTGQPVPTTREVVLALSAESSGEVEALVTRALELGGRPAQDRIIDGPMYGWSFLDLDGHHWELIYMAVPAAAS
jgi:predicted lactoylglutathione lyase